MDAFLWTGSALGAVLGLLHAVYLYRRRAGRGVAGVRATALYHGLWTFALWTLFGSYVLAFWILGAVGQSVARLIPAPREAGR